MTYAANGKYLLSGGSEKVQVWRVQDGKQMATMTAGLVRCVAMSKDGRWIAAGTFWGDVIVWNAVTHVKVISCRNDNSIIHAVDFSPDSTRLVTASENCTSLVWNILLSFSHGLAMWENLSPKHVPSCIDSACSTTHRISLERIPFNSHTASNSVPCRLIEIAQVLVSSVFSGLEVDAAETY